jgi:hypothetical protein
MIGEECAPCLGWWSLTRHQPRDGSFRHLDAEFVQFAVNPRRTPQWVGSRHLADQPTNLGIRGRTTVLASRAPGPPSPEPIPMPAHDRLRLDEDNCSAPTFPATSQQDPEDAVPTPKPWPPDRTLQRSQLLAEREVFKDQFAMAATGQRQCSCDQ